METGPYNTPPTLARAPFMAAFWALLAPFLFQVVGAELLGLFWPGFFEVIKDEDAARSAIRAVWIAQCVFLLAHFAVLSLWSERMGAGAFAGQMRASQNWVIAAILLGPVILLLPTLIAGLIFGGEESWRYSGEVNESLFATRNWSGSYLVYALLLAPLVEEITFRGVALGTLLARNVPPGMAMVLSSAAFTFLHVQYSVPALAVVFISGLGFAWLRLRSGTVLVPILAHMAANGFVTFLASLSPPPAG